jgi:hypothetical protein
MNGIQEQLMSSGNLPYPCLSTRLRDADDDLARDAPASTVVVEFEREHIGRSGDAPELPVEIAHRAVVN